MANKENSKGDGPSETIQPQTGGGAKMIAIGLVLAALVIGGVWRAHSLKEASAGKGPGARGEAPAVPVIDGVVARKDVPIYAEGLGTVQAFNSVTIRSRVDGQVNKVAFTEGQDVHAGDLLAQIDPTSLQAQLDQVKAKQGQDEALLANAKVDLERYADLLKKDGVTEQVFDTQKALVRQLEATVKSDAAAVQNVNVQLGYTTISSPIDGRVGIRLVDQGNIVRSSDAAGLVVINQLKPISVSFTLPGQILQQIPKDSSDLAVVALSSDGLTVLGEGKLAVIDNQIDPASATVKLKGTFPNEDLKLWPGQFVMARLLLGVRKGAATVPASVIQRGPDGAFAFVILEDLTVETRPVKIGQIENGEALVLEGLAPGDHVVVDGQYRLQKGSRVKLSDGSGSGGEGRGRGGKPGGPDRGGAGKREGGRPSGPRGDDATKANL